jgi:pimeloyl-ACP methyl ester carboxylesterase
MTRKPAKLLMSVMLWLTVAGAPSLSLAQGVMPSGHPGSIAELLRYEPTGLSLLSPYARGKIPVVFIHGLWSSPASWHRMVATLENDPAINEKYQFWTFGYSTGDPIPYSAYLLRRSLEGARRRFDLGRSDAAFERMVIVGHSMGGLVSKMMAVDAGDRLWRVISDRPFSELAGEKDDLTLFHDGLLFAARPEVRRVIYIATPHRGSNFDRGAIEHLGVRLVRVADPLRAAHDRLVSRNGPAFFRVHFRKAIPTSIDELEWGSPILTGLGDLHTVPAVKAHSIIAVRPAPPVSDRTDGLVRYVSAHIGEAVSEKVVASGHLCQDHPEVIAEVRRILAEHTGP